MTRPQLLSFLSEIKSNPDDDTSRLVLADWLADQGDDDRADLIRVQCRLARMLSSDPERPNLLRQELELLARPTSAWTHPLRGLCQQWESDRGLVRVKIDAGLLSGTTIEEILDNPIRPWVDHLTLTGSHEYIASLLADPDRARVLDQIGSLSLSAQQVQHWTPTSLAGAVLRCSCMPQLRRLNLEGTDLAEPYDLLTRSSLLGQLTELSLAHLNLGSLGAQALAWSPHLGRLRSLNLAYCNIGPSGLGALAFAPTLTGLENLNLACNRLEVDAARSLATSDSFARLRHLDLHLNHLGALGVQALSDASFLKNLESLDLRENHLGSEGVYALLAPEALVRLRRLDLYRNQLGDPGAIALSATPQLRNLTVLDLGFNQIHDDGAEAIARSEHLAGLRELHLHNNWITDAGAEVLADRMDRLVLLDLRKNNITGKARERLRGRLGDWVKI